VTSTVIVAKIPVHPGEDTTTVTVGIAVVLVVIVIVESRKLSSLLLLLFKTLHYPKGGWDY